MIFSLRDRIVFAGDSVTDAGSQTPVGEGLFDNTGFGYVRMVENLLMATYPELALRITNSGISGNTSWDLRQRWDRDVISLSPQWVSICIGVNDVWRQFDSPAKEQISPEEYLENVQDMIRGTIGRVKGIFVMSPYFMEPNRQDPMRARMDEYGKLCRHLAQKHGCIFVDLQAMFDRYFQFRHSSYISWDRVHPNQIGAMLIAKEFLSHCGFDYSHQLQNRQ